MAKGYAERIREKIKQAPIGAVFVNSDFADIAGSGTIRRNLDRLAEEGEVSRIMNGVYAKNSYLALLGEYSSPDPDEVAKALARRFGWTIAPSGNSALNMLGLSTQVPSKIIYLSDGPYRQYEWGKTRIEFLHRANKDISGLSFMTVLVVQALKEIGKGKVGEDTISILGARLGKKEKDAMIVEARHSTSWVYAIIKQIAEK